MSLKGKTIDELKQQHAQQAAIGRYVFRRISETGIIDPSVRNSPAFIARATYEDARYFRAHESEISASLRKKNLEHLFANVDEKQQPEQKRVRALGEVTNTPKAPRIHEPQARTEIVGMLPCKGYKLPSRKLFIGGRGDMVQVPCPTEEEDSILEAMLDEAESAEEEAAREQSEEEKIMELQLQERERVMHDMAKLLEVSGLCKAQKAKKYEYHDHAVVKGGSGGLPSCTVG